MLVLISWINYKNRTEKVFCKREVERSLEVRNELCLVSDGVKNWVGGNEKDQWQY